MSALPEPRVVTGMLLDGFTVAVDEALLITKPDPDKSWVINATLAEGTFFQPDDEVTARITLEGEKVLVGAAYVVAVTENTFTIMGWWELQAAQP